MESTGDMEAAIQFYETAQDFFSLVRVYCYCGDMEKVSTALLSSVYMPSLLQHPLLGMLRYSLCLQLWAGKSNAASHQPCRFQNNTTEQQL